MYPEPIPIIRQVEDLASLATRINAEHAAGQLAFRKTLVHYKNAGKMLKDAKELCGRGHWVKWCKANIKCCQRTINYYMQIDANWSKIANNANFTNAIEFLREEHNKDKPQEETEETEETEEPEETIEETEPLPHVAYNSGDNEWYTPPDYLDAVRQVLGTIELDPASSDKAQELVQATTYYTKDSDGLDKIWTGKTFLNPPYASNLIDKFTNKLIEHYNTGSVTEAIVLVNNATETTWFQTMAQHAKAICFPAKRIRFLHPDGKTGAPLQGQSLLYLGNSVAKFVTNFKTFGFICDRHAT